MPVEFRCDLFGSFLDVASFQLSSVVVAFCLPMILPRRGNGCLCLVETTLDLREVTSVFVAWDGFHDLLAQRTRLAGYQKVDVADCSG